MFWCVSYYFGAFETIWFSCETRCTTVRTSAKVRATKSLRNFFATNAPDPPHWTLNSCFCVLRTIWVELGQFGCLTNLGGKRAELGQKFEPRSRVGIFRLGAFRTIWLPYETQCKTGRTRAKICTTKSRQNDPQRMHPIHPIES